MGGWYEYLVLDRSSDFVFISFAKQMLVALDRLTLKNLDGMPPRSRYVRRGTYECDQGDAEVGDMLNIGMRQQSNLEGGIAWRQNRDFEDLLRRLNDGTTTETTTTNSTELLDSFHKARARESESEALERVKDDDDDDRNSDGEEGREGVVAAKKEKKKKKRKATAEEEEVEEREGLDRKERKKKKRKKSSSKDDDDEGRAPVLVPPSSIESEPQPPRLSSREARPARESGSVPMDTATATTAAMTAPVPVRAP